LEKKGNYISLSAIEKKLPEKLLRIHQSYLLTLSHIDSFNQHDVLIQGKEIPIGRHYKQQFQQWMDENVV
jgi:two-component system LytT family response regulator